MEDFFNPTRKDLLMIEQLIVGIKTNKSVLVKRKTSLEGSLTEIKRKMKNLNDKSKDYKKAKTTTENIKEHLNGIEIKIKNLNEELGYKNNLKKEIEIHLQNNKQLEGKEDLEKITKRISELKKKYAQFTKDRTRIASLRVMASEFITELEELTK